MNGEDIGTSFVQALSGRDWGGLAGLFQPSIQFRALVPSGLREASSDVDASGHFQQWFGKAAAVELVDFTVGAMLDRIHVSYRLRVQKDRWYGIEQQTFCVVNGDRIERMDLLCSGFRPEL
ncbi:MAG TPA: hypothetical protein VMV03_07460 [Spirochaetia bacterium]|nr:hypothetical protein [Spirochaetia bacterium]